MLIKPENIVQLKRKRFLIHQRIETEDEERFLLVSELNDDNQLIKGNATILKEYSNHVETLPPSEVEEILPLFFQ